MKMVAAKLSSVLIFRYLVALSLSIFFLTISASAQRCFDYEPKGTTVSLTGIFRSQIFPGPPNFESIKRGDRRETAYILKLSKPACTNADKDDEAENNIREMQLVVLNDGLWKDIRPLKGKRVTVVGTLFHASTGHHRTNVLIEVKSIRDAS